MSNQITNALIISQKISLRKIMKETLKSMSDENKLKQSLTVVNYLLNNHLKFKSSNHIALYLAMKHEEIDTHILIEKLLSECATNRKHIYAPHFEMKSNEMHFYEIKNMDQYKNEMNVNNKFGIKQFNDPTRLRAADPKIFDLVLVPGLAFDYNADHTKILRLGRGKGFYDSFLRQVSVKCYTLAVGFNEQFISFNEKLISDKVTLPVIETKDLMLDEFLCEKIIN